MNLKRGQSRQGFLELGALGGVLMMLVLLLVGFTLLTGVSWLAVMDRTGYWTLVAAAATAAGVARFREFLERRRQRLDRLVRPGPRPRRHLLDQLLGERRSAREPPAAQEVLASRAHHRQRVDARVHGVVGVEQRKDSIDDIPGPQSINSNAWGLTSAGRTKGSDTVKEAFTELEVPLISGEPLMKRLSFNGSFRYTNYDSYGSDTTWKAGLNWQLFDTLRLRAAKGTSFRAPALYELFLANQTSFSAQLSVDPCINWAQSSNPQIQKNCAAAGIPGDYAALNSSSATVIAGGGDRPDHVFAMLHSLAADRYASARIDGHLGASRFHVCHAHHPVDIHTQPGDTVSLLPVGGDAVVSADNLKWPLVNETLHARASRGVSNVATGRVDIAVHEGTLIAFTTPAQINTTGDPQ
mgnify:CR=1 FL=1